MVDDDPGDDSVSSIQDYCGKISGRITGMRNELFILVFRLTVIIASVAIVNCTLSYFICDLTLQFGGKILFALFTQSGYNVVIFSCSLLLGRL